jgi:hypothetical protein
MCLEEENLRIDCVLAKILTKHLLNANNIVVLLGVGGSCICFIHIKMKVNNLYHFVGWVGGSLLSLFDPVLGLKKAMLKNSKI